MAKWRHEAILVIVSRYFSSASNETGSGVEKDFLFNDLSLKEFNMIQHILYT